MSDFEAVSHLVKLQVAPTAVETEGTLLMGRESERVKSSSGAEVEINVDDISGLMDKRSELMKRGRVKRVYYQQTHQVQTVDMRNEFADLEELEEKQASEVSRCAQTQSGWMQRQQLMAMRQQQDEQFRMMELLYTTQKRSVEYA